MLSLSETKPSAEESVGIRGLLVQGATLDLVYRSTQ